MVPSPPRPIPAGLGPLTTKTVQSIVFPIFDITVVSRERAVVRGAARAGATMKVIVSPALPGKALLLRPTGFQPMATVRVRGGVATFRVPTFAVGRAQIVIIPDGARAERGQSSIFRIN